MPTPEWIAQPGPIHAVPRFIWAGLFRLRQWQFSKHITEFEVPSAIWANRADPRDQKQPRQRG